MLRLYKTIMNAAYAVMTPYFAIKSKNAKQEWTQRRVLKPESWLPMDLTDNLGQQKAGPCPCLFHASSVGEIRVLERLVKAVTTLKPNLKYCISTYTKAGHKLASEVFPDAEAVIFFPIDACLPLKRFFDNFHPRGIVMVETEIWPYFLDFCRKRSIPLVLANGRLTAKSTNSYGKFRSALSPLLDVYKKLIMQTDDDKKRMMAIGGNPEKIITLGNIKHDRNSGIDPKTKREEVRARFGLTDDDIFFVAASTRPGEESDIADALKKSSAFPDKIKVLLAPRHLDRLDEVASILDSAALPHILYGDIETGKFPGAPVILMDKIGLLAEIFYGADLSFVGGTLADLGGHNVMEPVLAGSPVIFGPSVHNVSDAALHIISEKQGKMVHNTDELAGAIDKFAEGSLTFQKFDSSGPSVAHKTAEIIIEELKL